MTNERNRCSDETQHCEEAENGFVYLWFGEMTGVRLG